MSRERRRPADQVLAFALAGASTTLTGVVVIVNMTSRANVGAAICGACLGVLFNAGAGEARSLTLRRALKLLLAAVLAEYVALTSSGGIVAASIVFGAAVVGLYYGVGSLRH
jgi:hypothetical protein